MFTKSLRAGRSGSDRPVPRSSAALPESPAARPTPAVDGPWLQIDNMPVSPVEQGLLASAALLAVAVPGAWYLWNGSHFTRICLPLACVCAAWRIAAALWPRRRTALAVVPALHIGADGRCALAGAGVPLQRAVFDFGWRNARQARIRCQVSDGTTLEWRIYRAKLDPQSWNRLCRWLQWQSRGRQTPVQA